MTEASIFAGALEKTGTRECAAYLAEACAGDEKLRRRVEALLRVHAEPDDLLDLPEHLTDTVAHVPLREGPGTVIGPYKLLQLIGEGGMGVVYMAEQQEPVRRKVALKIIKPGMDSAQVIARFEAERQALALMNYPNIATVLDAGTTDSGRPYFVLELVKGVPITKYCDDHHLTPSQRLELFIPVCQAVQHAHQKGVIHRDIKPSNVLVAEYDDKPVAKVIDFGVAKATGSKLTERTMFTEFGQIIGTLEYMSPEQAKLNALDVDTRSDIYALGVLLYELLTGTTPVEKKRFRETAIDEMLRIIRDEEPPKPSTRLTTTLELQSIAANRGLDPKKLSGLLRGELDWIVMKALEKDRTRRYETATALGKDIKRYLTGDTVEACPPSAGYRLRKLARKHRPALAVVTAFSLLLVAAAAVSSVQAVRATQAERDARDKSASLAGAEVQVRAERDDARGARDQLRQSLVQTDLARDWADRLRLGVQSELIRPRNPGLALLLAIEAARRQPNVQANSALYAALDECEEVRTFLGHRAEVEGLVFSPDGKRLITWANDNSARLWEVATGREIAVLRHQDWVLGRRDTPILQARFSPDGRRVLTLSLARYNFGTRSGSLGGIQSTASIWDAATGAKVVSWRLPDNDVRSPEGAASPDPRHTIGFSPDGARVILTTGGLPAPCVWEVATGRALFSLEGHEAPVIAVAYSPDGRHVATGSVDHSARVWDAATGKQVAVFTGHACGVALVQFSPDGRVLSLGDGCRHVVRDAPGKLSRVRQVLQAPQAREEPAGFIWDAATGQMLVSLKWPKPDYGFCATAEFSPDGALVITAGERSGSHVDGRAPNRQNEPNIWDGKTGAILHTLKEPARNWGGANVVSAAFGAGGSYVVTTHNHGRVARLWNTTTGVEVDTNFVGHSDTVGAAAFSPDGRFLATGSADTTARLWDLGALQAAAPHRGRWKANGPVFSPDGRRLAVTELREPGKLEWASYIHIWDLDTFREVICKGNGKFLVNSLAFSPDGRWLVAGLHDGVAQLWETSMGKPGPVLWGHDGMVLDARFSLDGRRIVTTSRDQTVRVWDAASGRQTLLLHKDGAALASASFSPDGRQVLTDTAGSEDSWRGNRGWIWDAETGTELAAFDSRQSISRVPMTWAPDGRRVLAAVVPGQNLDNSEAAHSLSVCDAATGREVRRLVGHTKQITSAAFSPDGRRIITGSWDRTARVWDAVTGALVVVLSGHDQTLTAVAFSSDGRRAVTVSLESVRLWDAAEFSDSAPGRPARPLAVLTGDAKKRNFQTAYFSPDSSRLLTVFSGTGGPITQLWPANPLAAAEARKPRELTAEERELYDAPAHGGQYTSR